MGSLVSSRAKMDVLLFYCRERKGSESLSEVIEAREDEINAT